jgi:hypothetical protein
MPRAVIITGPGFQDHDAPRRYQAALARRPEGGGREAPPPRGRKEILGWPAWGRGGRRHKRDDASPVMRAGSCCDCCAIACVPARRFHCWVYWLL